MRDTDSSDKIRADGGTMVTINKSQEQPVNTVLEGVAALKGVPVEELDPLYDSVEPDALERMVQHAQQQDCDLAVGFSFEGCMVLLQDDGKITINPV